MLRKSLGLTGTKKGCGEGDCCSCSVIIDGELALSCITLAVACQGKEILTIEGLAQNGELHPVQQAWIDHQVPQCGYCQSGQIMQAAGFLENTPNPNDEQITEAMNGNLCRCMAYTRIRKAVKAAAGGEEA